ncbi:unnamed protein product [Cyprideis torosa]|uniref:ER membrane protein complex subunit 10 n=1 Tax=Cyprideis torosa TaxID=163714 RepID=A0A7R8W6G2_9CRUS|nr:unnamed protein product [Cyprideis torosa]CAG0882281.1 unnamed protein product [Cyprideis torosa]
MPVSATNVFPAPLGRREDGAGETKNQKKRQASALAARCQRPSGQMEHGNRVDSDGYIDEDGYVDSNAFSTGAGLTLELLHAFGENSEYSLRGKITIEGSSVLFSTPNVLTAANRKALEDVAIHGGFYFLRAKHNGIVVQTFYPACPLVSSNLREILTFTLDSSGTQVKGLHITSDVPYCETTSLQFSPGFSGHFNTTAVAKRIQPGPIPDTASYLQKLEDEKRARERGEGKDNRTFLQKYWLYILIGFAFLMMTNGGGGPDGGTGGGR